MRHRGFKHSLHVAVCTSLYLLVGTHEAEACFCTDSPSFAKVASERPLVVVARVEALGPMVKGFFVDENPAFADVEVLWIGKGSANAPRIRVWDHAVGSDCGSALRQIRVGTHAVFALNPARTGGWGLRGEMNPDSRKYEWFPAWISPPVPTEVLKVVPQGPVASDYDVSDVCGEPLLVLKTQTDIAQYVGKKIP